KILKMKQNSTFTSFLAFLIAIILLTITSMLMSSCSGVKYSYFSKQRVPYTASGETKRASPIPAKPFLNQTENELKGKASSLPGNTKQKTTAQSEPRKKSSPET